MPSNVSAVARRAGLACVLGVSMAWCASASSATVTYVMNQSNRIADDVAYLDVQLTEGASGAVDVTVRALPALMDLANGKFGIQKFALNLQPGIDADDLVVAGLPDGWKVKRNGQFDGFGTFDLYVQGSGSTRVPELAFSITSAGQSLLNLVSPSTTGSRDVAALFVAKVHGLRGLEAGSQASFAAMPASVVPIPAAGWLLGAALGSLMCLSRTGRSRD